MNGDTSNPLGLPREEMEYVELAAADLAYLWRDVPVYLILDGIYERIHETIGVPTPLSDDDRRRAKAVRDRSRA